MLVVGKIKKQMNLYYSKSHSDEDGYADSAKMMMIFGSKSELIKICDFFNKVKIRLENHQNCHMHFRDSFDSWDKTNDFDIEINLD
jgi:hypothetical protein